MSEHIDTERFAQALGRRNGSRTASSLERPLEVGPMAVEVRAFLAAQRVPSALVSFLEAHCFDHHVTIGHLTFDMVSDLVAENLDEMNARCIEERLLVIGSGLNGDPIVVDLETMTVGFVNHDELWDEERPPARPHLVDSGLSIGAFYLAAAIHQETFPVDAYDAAELGAGFGGRFAVRSLTRGLGTDGAPRRAARRPGGVCMVRPMAGERDEYVLGTGDAELARLEYQHTVWAARSAALWERAGFARGQRLLDLGCGPGFATRDLARVVGPDGSVVAVDASRRFVANLTAQAASPGDGPIEGIVADVREVELSPASLDGAYARWVLCFVPEAERAIARVAGALKPGASFAIFDYLDYLAMRVLPGGEWFERVVRAIDASWRARGSETDIAQRLPELCDRHGLRVAELTPFVRTARPGTMAWAWITDFFRAYLPSIVPTFLAQDELDVFFLRWTERTADPRSHFLMATLAEVIAVKSGSTR